MGFTLVQSTRRRVIAVVALVIVAAALYETRMLDSGYTAWLEMTSSEDEAPSPGSHLVFDATAYCKGTTTAAGVNVRRGIAAADPKLLPVGSVVTLVTGDPEYNGVYTIMDTGPKVQGRQLDLYVWNCNEALSFGRRRIEVSVLRLGWDPRASSPSLIDRLFRRREVARRVAESKAAKDEDAPESATPDEGAPVPTEPPADAGVLGTPPDAGADPPPPPLEIRPVEPPAQGTPALPH